MQRGRDAVRVLLVPDILRVEREGRALIGRLLEQDRLEQRLDDIHHATGARTQIIAAPIVTGPPSPHPDEFGAGQTCRESRVTHQFPGARIAGHVLRNAKVAENLVGALVRDVGSRTIGHPVAARHEMTANATVGERQSGRRAGGPAPMMSTSVSYVICLLRDAPYSRGFCRSVSATGLLRRHHRHAGDPAWKLVEFLLNLETAARGEGPERGDPGKDLVGAAARDLADLAGVECVGAPDLPAPQHLHDILSETGLSGWHGPLPCLGENARLEHALLARFLASAVGFRPLMRRSRISGGASFIDGSGGSCERPPDAAKSTRLSERAA